MPNRSKSYTDTAQDIAEDAARRTRDAIDEAAKKAKDRAREFGQLASETVDDTRVAAAEALHDTSSRLHDAADAMPAETVSEIAHSAADRIEQGATYVEDTPPAEMLSDLLDVVRRHPGPSLVMAASLGFLFAQILRRR